MLNGNKSLHALRPKEIKKHYRKDGDFFNGAGQRYFGDAIESYGVVTVDNERFMFRKPNASVTIAGVGKMKTGRQFFDAWRVVPLDSGEVDLLKAPADTIEAVYGAVRERYPMRAARKAGKAPKGEAQQPDSDS